MAGYNKNQPLNDWAKMLNELYGVSQNYGRSPYELHAHLTEVSGALGKHLLKRKALDSALEFLPKVFAWAIALVNKVKTRNAIEDLILRKYPAVCPYCLKAPCECWQAGKPRLDQELLSKTYYSLNTAGTRSVDEFQMMFRRIYEVSWTAAEPFDVLRMMHTRLIEELSEIAEALRFHHLYESNFENEMADFLAWWFGIVSTLHRLQDGKPMLLASDILWPAYPGFCPVCELAPCFCRPSPVRALISKPSQLEFVDSLTSLYNQRAYTEHIQKISNGTFPISFPATCVRIDLDKFKDVNDSLGHAAGDDVLRNVAAVIRKKARERDKIYRVGGDEFAVLCSDYSVGEATGMIERVAADLKSHLIAVSDLDGNSAMVGVTMSVGISPCHNAGDIDDAFKRADQAAYESKTNGRDRITVSA